MDRLQWNEFVGKAAAIKNARGLCLFSRRTIVLLTAILFACSGIGFAQKKQKLDKNFRDWLERDVAYIITKDERDAFLKLTTDEAREKFIETFWEIRNPSPGSPTNVFRDEHYQRLTYASEHFGKESGNNGWRTAMGRTYIVLGPPQQRQTYHDSQDLRPTEVWFYSNGHAALPPFFYLVFYREDNFSEYKLYSPAFDGPQKLVTQRGLTRLQAWQTIEKSGSGELARIALSLLPDEPIDTHNATSSMESDIMLGILHDLPNHPLSVEELNLQQMRASVRATLVFTGKTLGVLALPVRNAEGDTRVDYLLRLSKPEDFSLAETSGDRYYFNISVRSEVYGADNKLVFTQERTYTKNLNRDQYQRIKDRVFGFEGSLPLPPGNYHLEFQFTDWLKKVSYRVKQDVVIPQVSAKGLVVTEIVPFSVARPVTNGNDNLAPFSFGGVKFTPLLKRETNFSAGGQIKFFYQIWAPHVATASTPDQKLKVIYAYGRPGARQDSQTIEDEVSKTQFDANGSLLNGKEILIGDWAAGNYKLVLTLQDPGTHQEAFSSLNFQLSPGAAPFPSWDIDDSDDASKEMKAGVSDYERGLCYLVHGENGLASKAFRSALEKNPNSQQALRALVDAEFLLQAYDEVAKRAGQVELTDKTDETTVLRLAESLNKVGNTRMAVELLESGLKLKPASGPLYLALAEYYGHLGDSKKAEEYTRKGKQLIGKSTSATP
jgi:GWxTD domain-containing protein